MRGFSLTTAAAFLAFSALPALSAGNAECPLEVNLAGAAVVEPGLPPAAVLNVTNRLDQPISAAVEFSVQHDDALFPAPPPDPVHGLDHALGARSWTEADGTVIEEGSLTDGTEWTAAETKWINDHFTETFQFIDLGRARRITHMTWLGGDANWVAKVDVAASLDGTSYTAVPSLERVDLYKKWGTNVFSLAEPFEARYLRFRYHQDGARAPIIRMPAAISVYDGVDGEPRALPAVGPVFARGQMAVEVPAGGSASLPLAAQGTLETGAYLVAAKLDVGARTYFAWRHVLVLPRPLKRTGTSRLGLNASDARVHDNLERLGIGWVRFENLKWPFVSPERGVFAFDGSIGPWHVNHDAMFESYRAHGIDILPYLFLTQDYATPPGASPESDALTRPPKDFTQYAEFVFQTVARYGSVAHPPAMLKTADKKCGRGLIRVFELWNEPNLNDPSWGHWKGPIEQYYEMFRLGAEAVKRADPAALVANGGYSGIGVELVDTLRSYTYADGKRPLDFVDVLSVHFYTGRCAPETARVNANTGSFGAPDPRTFEENMVALADWRDRTKAGMPIWLTETGYETIGEFGIGERTQAAWLARDVLLGLASGAEKVMVFRETGSDPGRWGSAGVMRTDASLKPSFFTYATLIREMDGIEGGALRLKAAGDNVRVYAWNRAGKTMLSAWAIEGTAPFPLRLGIARVTDSFGFRREIDTAGLMLTVFPVYIRDMADAQPLEPLLDAARRVECGARRRDERGGRAAKP
jgi:hypothetical protein